MNGMRIVGQGLLVLAFSVGGCGGSNGGPSGNSTVTGTAAAGGPIASVTVTLKSASGSSRTATTASDGTFSIDTSGLTPPFLVQIVNPASTKLYSVSADANAQSTINVTPLTDLIIRSWYDVQGVSVDDAFAALASNPAPTPTAVSVISNVVTNIVQLWMNQAGVTGSDFNLISTPFTADGTGIDHVLDLVAVDTSTGDVTITDGTTTQTSTVSYSTSNGSMSVSTATTGADGTSTSTGSTVVPVQTAQQTAVDAIATACNNFAATINSKGTSLQASDLLPYLDPTNGLWGGLTPSQWAQQIAYVFHGKTVSFSGIAVKSLDTTGNVADTVFQLSESQGGQTSTSPQELFFRKVSGAWLLFGNQRMADVEVRENMVTNQGTGSGSDLMLEANVNAPQGTVTGVTVSGGPWTSAISLTPGATNVAPWDNTLHLDSFGTNIQNPSISGGTPFTFVVTPSSGSPATYTLAINAITNETISITNLTGSTLADAHLGSPMTVNWTLPKTFAISQVRLGTVAYAVDPGTQSTLKCDDMGEQQVLGTTATTAQITIPATCGGPATAQAEIYLQVYGTNGELTTVYYTYQG